MTARASPHSTLVVGAKPKGCMSIAERPGGLEDTKNSDIGMQRFICRIISDETFCSNRSKKPTCCSANRCIRNEKRSQTTPEDCGLAGSDAKCANMALNWYLNVDHRVQHPPKDWFTYSMLGVTEQRLRSLISADLGQYCGQVGCQITRRALKR